MKTAEEILERESRREKGVYMDQASYQSGVVLKAIREAQRDAYIQGYRDAEKGDDPLYDDGLGS